MKDLEIVNFDIEVLTKRKQSYTGFIRNCKDQDQKNRYSHKINLTDKILNELRIQKKILSTYNPKDIEKAVSEYYFIPIESMRLKNRDHELVDARQICMITHRLVGMYNLYDCADMYNRDHATAIHSINSIRNAMFQNDARSKKIRRFIETHEINGTKLIDIIKNN